MKKRWSILDIQNILKLRRLGLKLKDISNQYAVTSNAIRKLVKRYDPSRVKTNFDHINDQKLNGFIQDCQLFKYIDHSIFNNQTAISIDKVIKYNIQRIKKGLPVMRIKH